MKKASRLTCINIVTLPVFLLSALCFVSCKTHKNLAATDNHHDVKLPEKTRIDFERFFFDGAREKVLGNYELAETSFLQALKLDPTSAATMYELATIYSFQNNKNQALFYSKKAATSDPQNSWYQLLYAESLKESKKPGEAALVYEKLLQNFPDRIDFYYELANVYLFANKPNDAIKTYNRIEERVGVSENASMQKIKIYKSLNNSDKAIEEAKKLINAFPKEGKYYGIVGELYQEKGQSEKALQAYNDLLKIDPENAYVHLSLADYYRNQKQNEKSFEEIKIAFRSKLLDIDTKIKILLSYYSITETYSELKSDADTLCKILVAVHPDEAKAFSMYGDFLYRDKKLDQARIEYRKSISLDKEKYALWNQLLIIESELNDYTALEKESKEAVELFPNQALPYFFNGAANIQLKNFQAAVDILTDGKNFVFDKQLLAQFYATIGDAQNQLKRYAASDSAYNKALELDPNNVYVLNNYAYYLSIRNTDLERAERMSKKTNDLEPDNNSYQDTYGWILYQMKKYDDAKIWVGKALENGGRSNGTLLEHYGDILYQLGDKENAIKYWEDAKKAGASELIDKKIMEKKLYE